MLKKKSIIDIEKALNYSGYHQPAPRGFACGALDAVKMFKSTFIDANYAGS